MPKKLTWKKGEIVLNRCRVMGVLNVTPDSFSDGGQFMDSDRAVARAWQIVAEGADILDVGGESTRPGSEPVDEAAERARLWPVLETLMRDRYPLPISLDSRKPLLVAQAIESNLAHIINDVEGLRNSEMRKVVRETHSPVIIMHMMGLPKTMQQDYVYRDVVQDILAFFRAQLEEPGIVENVVLDPGIGFGKSVQHNLTILRHLKEFTALGFPVLVGVSRKSFIGKVLDLEVGNRLEGGLAATAIAVMNGASLIRTHDVTATVRAVRMAEAIAAA